MIRGWSSSTRRPGPVASSSACHQRPKTRCCRSSTAARKPCASTASLSPPELPRLFEEVAELGFLDAGQQDAHPADRLAIGDQPVDFGGAFGERAGLDV